MKVLVTGSNGFLGQNLVRSLLGNGFSVRCLDRSDATPFRKLGIEFFQGDVEGENFLARATEGCDAVVHMACSILPQMSNVDPAFDVASNVGGTLNLLNASVKSGVRRIVFISSGGTVYGVPNALPIAEDHPTNPTCSYGITKLTCEKYLRLFHGLHGIETVSLRLANPYGPYQRVRATQGAISVFCYRAMKDEPIEIWGDGSVCRDFLYVGDAVGAILRAIEKPVACGEINVGSGKATSLNELLDAISQILGRRLNVVYRRGRDFDVPTNVLDVSRAKAVLGWEPQVELAEGLARTMEWIRLNCL